jgi:hypothetical protein
MYPLLVATRRKVINKNIIFVDEIINVSFVVEINLLP